MSYQVSRAVASTIAPYHARAIVIIEEPAEPLSTANSIDVIDRRCMRAIVDRAMSCRCHWRIVSGVTIVVT